MEHPLTDNWFVLRDLTRPNAKRPAYRLLEEKGIEVFTPMRWQLVERKGKRIREEVPLLHDLLFAHTTCACMDPIVEEISTLQYRYLRGGYRKPMTVGHAEMNRFIRAVHSDDSPRYFLVEELTPAMYGRMIRIEGGPLDGYEGRLLSIRGSRVKRLIVEIPGLLVAAVEVDPEYIRLLKRSVESHCHKPLMALERLSSRASTSNMKCWTNNKGSINGVGIDTHHKRSKDSLSLRRVVRHGLRSVLVGKAYGAYTVTLVKPLSVSVYGYLLDYHIRPALPHNRYRYCID